MTPHTVLLVPGDDAVIDLYPDDGVDWSCNQPPIMVQIQTALGASGAVHPVWHRTPWASNPEAYPGCPRALVLAHDGTLLEPAYHHIHASHDDLREWVTAILRGRLMDVSWHQRCQDTSSWWDDDPWEVLELRFGHLGTFVFLDAEGHEVSADRLEEAR
jgi:hypothetical protein